jgi:hypothetical protein
MIVGEFEFLEFHRALIHGKISATNLKSLYECPTEK